MLRSDLVGIARYSYCPSHARWSPGLRLHRGLHPAAGLPVTWALADPRLDERQVLMCMLDAEPHLLAERSGLLRTDKCYISAELDLQPDAEHARVSSACASRVSRGTSAARAANPTGASSTAVPAIPGVADTAGSRIDSHPGTVSVVATSSSISRTASPGATRRP